MPVLEMGKCLIQTGKIKIKDSLKKKKKWLFALLNKQKSGLSVKKHIQ